MAFPQTDIIDGNSLPQTINTLPDAGQATRANSLGVTGSVEDQATQDAIKTATEATQAAVEAPVTSLPPFAPSETSSILRAQITPSTSGTHTLVAAGASGSTIRVYALLITNAAEVTATLVGDTALGNLPLISRTSGIYIGEQMGGLPIYVTDADADLEVSLSGNVQCEITVWYIQGVPTP